MHVLPFWPLQILRIPVTIQRSQSLGKQQKEDIQRLGYLKSVMGCVEVRLFRVVFFFSLCLIVFGLAGVFLLCVCVGVWGPSQRM